MELQISDGVNIASEDISKEEFERRMVSYNYWAFHHRSVFLRTLPYGAKVLDLGAGGGYTPGIKTQYPFPRPDLEVFALDLKYSENFKKYDGYQICDFTTDKLNWPDGYFDAVFTTHVMEHIPDIGAAMRACNSMLRAGGALYAELPANHTKRLPQAAALGEIGSILMSNFFEDATHLDTPKLADLIVHAERAEFFVLESGYIRNDFADGAMISHGQQHDTRRFLDASNGYWGRTLWCQYMIGRKRDPFTAFVGQGSSGPRRQTNSPDTSVEQPATQA